MLFRALSRVGVRSAIALLVSVGTVGCAKTPTSPENATLETIDGRSISAMDLDQYVTSAMDAAGVMGLQMAVINRGQVVYTNEMDPKAGDRVWLPTHKRSSELYHSAKRFSHIW